MGREQEPDLFGEPVDLSEGVDEEALAYSHSSTHMAPLVAPPDTVPREDDSFCAGRQVRILRTRTRERNQRIGEVGRGRLIEDVKVGRPARLAVESGPALITSPVKLVAQISPRAVQIQTANSFYKIELVD